jgi:short-subunit dehydrogenase
MKNKIIILGITSDIGKELAKMFYEDNYEVVGTYNSSKNLGLLTKKNIKLLKIDMNNINNKDIIKLKKLSNNWKIFISCVGTISPIGKFFDNKIEKIKENFNINFFSNLEILKKIIVQRNKKSHLFFFSGSGSNGPSNELSAYCLSKLLLIKSAELISAEYPNLNCTTIGPGFIDTKIHKELISKKVKFKKAYGKYLSLKNREIDNNNPYKNIYSLIKKCIKYPIIAKGRNFSSKYDNWNNIFLKFQKQLKTNENLFKLRRHDKI